MINSKQKGNAGERELANKLKEYGFNAKPRDDKGRFIVANNYKVIIKNNIAYFYDENGKLMFFTDDLRTIDMNWSKVANGYFCCYKDGNATMLHRFISNPKKDEVVDHINRNKKDNTKSNLRNTNKSVNAFNSKKRVTNKSGTTGIYYRKDTGKWVARIKFNYKDINLGCYKNIEDAIKARKEGEIKYYGYQLKN